MALAEHGLDRDLIGAALATAQSAASSDIWTRAMASGNRLVEVPFETVIPAEENDTGVPTLVRGVIDLAFREPDGWVIVDYKTDASAGQRLTELTEHYRGQVKSYAQLWGAMLGDEVKEAGLFFTSAGTYVTV